MAEELKQLKIDYHFKVKGILVLKTKRKVSHKPLDEKGLSFNNMLLFDKANFSEKPKQ
jgi:hypothetical protein